MSRRGAPSGWRGRSGMFTRCTCGRRSGCRTCSSRGITPGGRWRAGFAYRLTDHALGRGARLTQLQREAGGSWVLAGVERGVTKDREHQLKYRGASRRCERVPRGARRPRRAGSPRSRRWSGPGGTAPPTTSAGCCWRSSGWRRPRRTWPSAPPRRPSRSRSAPAPAFREATPEQLAEMDALVDRLCAQWRAEADAAAGTAAPETQAEPGPESEPELEASA